MVASMTCSLGMSRRTQSVKRTSVGEGVLRCSTSFMGIVLGVGYCVKEVGRYDRANMTVAAGAHFSDNDRRKPELFRITR